jgi:hypothetical protein
MPWLQKASPHRPTFPSEPTTSGLPTTSPPRHFFSAVIRRRWLGWPRASTVLDRRRETSTAQESYNSQEEVYERRGPGQILREQGLQFPPRVSAFYSLLLPTSIPNSAPNIPQQKSCRAESCKLALAGIFKRQRSLLSFFAPYRCGINEYYRSC